LDREERPYLLLARQALLFRDFLQGRTSVDLWITLEGMDGWWDVEAPAVAVVPRRSLQRQHVFATYGYGAGFDGCFVGDEHTNWFGDPSFVHLGDRRRDGISLRPVPDDALGELLVHLANSHYATESGERLTEAVRQFTAGWQRQAGADGLDAGAGRGSAALVATFDKLLAQPS